MSIDSRMKKYADGGFKRWHTPGHKGSLDLNDLTEIGGDGGVFPSLGVYKAQEKAAKFYGSKYCFFLVGGSSAGMKAAIMSAGGDIIAPKNRHICVDMGAALARVDICEFDTGKDDDGLYRAVGVGDMKLALKKYPQAKAVVITSPDYYGITSSARVADEVHAAGKLLIVDSAHGAHFAARRDLFGDGFSSVADLCVMSAHKTMHAYTQSAYMCCNDKTLAEKAEACLALIGTTSPSYLLLAGLENAVEYAKKNAVGYDGLKAATDAFREKIDCVRNGDFTRLVVKADKLGMSGKELFYALKEKGHVAEMFDDKRTVFIVTLDDTPDDVRNLCECIVRIRDER
ncbi:MAG: hypothetical protein HFE48_00800 [Clostridia bacterium]|nr:hypothetical protein [Clostridia bacterium]